MPMCDPERRLHAVMAGNGNAYDSLSILRLRILRQLHESPSLDDLSAALEQDLDGLNAELTALRQVSLLTDSSGALRPNVLVATAEETQRVDAHARVLGEELAWRLIEHQGEIESAYDNLTISQTVPLAELAFVLIGDRILDVGLLDSLAREGTLMPAAPARPSVTQPDARYYFWLIEGDHDQLGRYGQRATSLPGGDGWELLTFGQYTFGDEPNVARERIEQEILAYSSTDQFQDPHHLASTFGLPLIDQADAARWWAFARQTADDLLAVYADVREPLHELYGSLRASAYLGDDGFGEFFCWYDHVAYAHAIDALEKTGLLSIPTERFAAVLWQEPDNASRF